LIILCTSASVLLLAAAAVWFYDLTNSQMHLLSHLDTMAEITGANSSAALAFENKPDASEVINALRARPEVDIACLSGKDGKPFVYFAKPGIALASITNFAAPSGHLFDRDRLIVKREVRLDNDVVGYITLCANLREQHSRSHAFILVASASFVGLIGVALLVAIRLQRVVTGPISELSAAAVRITADNDYGVRVPITSRDEIGALVTAFNKMLAEIERQNRKLVESETRLTLALDASRMGVWEWEVESDLVVWSNEFTAVFANSSGITIEKFAARVHPDDSDHVLNAFKKAVADGSPFLVEYRVLKWPEPVVWIEQHGQVRRGADGSTSVLACIVQDISRRKQEEAEHQNLTAKLLHAEDDERRRIARELHDTTIQHLAALKLNLGRVQETDSASAAQALSPEMRGLLDQALLELRTFAYVLHPPVLDELGLVGALKDFAAGVSRRSAVQVTVHTDEYSGRLQQNIEFTLFRVAQESVANAIHHSGTRTITIRLARDREQARLEIQDFGHGFDAHASTPYVGVGLAAMRERMTLIGGELFVDSDSEGTTVLAAVPLHENASAKTPVTP